MLRYALFAGVALGVSMAGHAVVAQGAGGDAGHGRQLFMADGCYECHGTVGQGGGGRRLAPSPPPAAVIAAYIRRPAGEMPPYSSKVVSDGDVRDIYAYLASVAPPPKVADIPELK